MKIGYARVSTPDQNLDLQIDALQKFQCDRIFSEKVSGTICVRQGLNEALNFCREGDTFVVWKLDRLGRSHQHLIETIQELGDRSIEFISLDNNINTTTPAGKLIFHIMSSLAEFERDLIAERTVAGINIARQKGVKLGRPQKISQEMINKAKELFSKNVSITEICRVLSISRSSFYNQINPLLFT